MGSPEPGFSSCTWKYSFRYAKLPRHLFIMESPSHQWHIQSVKWEGFRTELPSIILWLKLRPGSQQAHAVWDLMSNKPGISSWPLAEHGFKPADASGLWRTLPTFFSYKTTAGPQLLLQCTGTQAHRALSTWENGLPKITPLLGFPPFSDSDYV